MQLSRQLLSYALVLFAATSVISASSWTFDEATVSVQDKKAGVGGVLKEKLVPNKALSRPVTLGSSDTLRILLTAKDDNKPKRPHQAFLLIKDPSNDLETSFAFSVKDSGKSKLELSHKDIPTQLIKSSTPLTASLVIASFGSSKPHEGQAFDFKIDIDPNFPIAVSAEPLRYGKLPEIHHIFKTDPTSPPKIITLVFSVAVVAALPVLLVTWLSLGANINHLPKALGDSPVSHAVFFLSIIAMEGLFFLYYTSRKLFQVLPAAAVIGLITFLSGSRALSEVQARRVAGLR